MGAFDQAARYAAHTEPIAVIDRLLRDEVEELTFSTWFEPRAQSSPGDPERVADLIAILDDPEYPKWPWFMILEFQAQVNATKLRVMLEETGILHARGRSDKYQPGHRVLTALIHLHDPCRDGVLNMTLKSGAGTRHQALVWNIHQDDAIETLERVGRGEQSWGMLFWVPLMANAEQESVIRCWKELVDGLPDADIRENMIGIALVFAELAKCYLEWERQLRGWKMTESKVVNGWIEEALLDNTRNTLIRLVQYRFRESVPNELISAIQMQPSREMLDGWFEIAANASTVGELIEVMRREN